MSMQKQPQKLQVQRGVRQSNQGESANAAVVSYKNLVFNNSKFNFHVYCKCSAMKQISMKKGLLIVELKYLGCSNYHRVNMEESDVCLWLTRWGYQGPTLNLTLYFVGFLKHH